MLPLHILLAISYHRELRYTFKLPQLIGICYKHNGKGEGDSKPYEQTGRLLEHQSGHNSSFGDRTVNLMVVHSEVRIPCCLCLCLCRCLCLSLSLPPPLSFGISSHLGPWDRLSCLLPQQQQYRAPLEQSSPGDLLLVSWEPRNAGSWKGPQP